MRLSGLPAPFRTLALGLALVLPLAGRAQAPSSGRPAAESLAFEVHWGAMLVGRARIETLPSTNPGLYLLRTTVKANNAIQSIYPVLDTVESWVTVGTDLPTLFRKRLSEGNYRASVQVDFDQASGQAKVSGVIQGKARSDTALQIPGGVHDLLSAFHFVRRQRLEPGKSLHLSLVDNRKFFRDVEIACLRREVLETPLGKWNTVVIEPKLHADALFKAKGRLQIWLTDDERHMPVQMVSRISMGSIRAVLISHAP